MMMMMMIMTIMMMMMMMMMNDDDDDDITFQSHDMTPSHPLSPRVPQFLALVRSKSKISIPAVRALASPAKSF